ncbi:hypothetical protein HYU96_04670 [Candidatus Daviesbacteria bacterium]|nr:hypothetical protein [Candidatus Daviesbacteria bacterium]
MKKQIAIVVILLLGIAVSLFLSQRQQILKGRASLQAYNAFGVSSSDGQVSCEGNVCTSNSLNITMSVRDLTALEVTQEVASRQCLWQSAPLRCTGCGVASIIEQDSCSGEVRVVADDVHNNEECNLPEWCGSYVTQNTTERPPEQLPEPSSEPQGEPQQVCEEKSYCDDNLGLRVFWNTCNGTPIKEAEFDPECILQEQIALNLQLRQEEQERLQNQPEPSTEPSPEPTTTELFKPIDTGFSFDPLKFVQDSKTNVGNFLGSLGQAALEERNLPELGKSNRQALGKAFSGWLNNLNKKEDTLEARCQEFILSSYQSGGFFLPEENPCQGVDLTQTQVSEENRQKERVQTAEALVSEGADNKTVLTTFKVDLDAEEEKLNVGGCLIPFINRGCVTWDVAVQAKGEDLGAVLRKNKAVELAGKLGESVDKPLSEWDPQKKEYFLKALSKIEDFDVAKMVAEFAIPLSVYEETAFEFDFCRKQMGNLCLLNPDTGNNYLAVANLSLQDIEKANVLAKEIKPGFAPEDPNLVQSLARFLDLHREFLDYYIDGNPKGIAFADPQVARGMGISLEQLQRVKATYRAWEDVGVHIRKNTFYGQQLSQKQEETVVLTAVAVATFIDPALPLEGITMLAKGTASKIAKPVVSKVFQKLGKEEGEKVVEMAEQVLAKGAKGGLYTAEERQALERINEAVAAVSGEDIFLTGDTAALVRSIENGGGIENPALDAIRTATSDPNFKQTAAQGLKRAQTGADDLNKAAVVITPEDAKFVSAGSGNPVEAVQRTVDGVIDDLTGGAQPPASKLAEVADSLDRVADNLIGRPLAPCPILGLVPVVYAAVSTPCPSNPLDKVAHNLEAAFAKDAIERNIEEATSWEDLIRIVQSQQTIPLDWRITGVGSASPYYIIQLLEAVSRGKEPAYMLPNWKGLKKKASDLANEGKPLPVQIVQRVESVARDSGENIARMVDDIIHPPPTQVERLEEVNRALVNGQKTEELREFWRSIVRDSDGSLQKYQGIVSEKYYKGPQPDFDLSDPDTTRYIMFSISTRLAFLEDLARGRQHVSLPQFKQWLIELHQGQAYKHNQKPGEIVSIGSVTGGYHSPFVRDDVVKIAQKYGDPYTEAFQKQGGARDPYKLVLPGIRPEGGAEDAIFRPFSRDKPVTVIYSYPNPSYFDDYIEQMQIRLKRLELMGEEIYLETQLKEIAEFYQYAIVARMFSEVNQSLFMNMVNGLLEQRGLRAIPHGILDFAALRLQPDNFAKYFNDEVVRGQGVKSMDELQELWIKSRGLAPCPILVGLIPVVLAQGAGGGSPCPKNPLAAMARNAGNAFEKAKDGVGGWVDNIKGVFKRGEKEVSPSNLNFEEQTFIKSAERVSNITPEDIKLLDNVAKKVAEQAEQFDYVVVTGGSRDVSLVLLQKQGVNPKKIIEFDEYLNKIAYKDLSEFPDLPQLTDEQRTEIIRNALIAKGVSLNGLDKPRILIVDDIARSGGKTVEYLRRFEQIEGIGEYKFAVFASQFGEIELGNPLIFKTTPEELQKFPQLVFIPKGLTKEEERNAYLLLNDLAQTVSVRSNKGSYVNEVSDIVLAKVDEAASTGLQRIRSSSTPKNFFENVGDTVGGWVDNLKGVFKGKEKRIMKIEGQSNIPEAKQLFDEIQSAGNIPGDLKEVLDRKVSFDQYGARVANFTRFKARVGDNLLLGTTHTNTPAERALIDQFFEEVVKRDIDTVYFEQAPLNAGVDLKLWLASNGYISQQTAQLLGGNVDGSELIYLFEKLTKRGIKVVNMDLSSNPSVPALVFAIEHYGIERTVRDLNQHLFLVSQATLLSSAVDHLPVDVLRSEKIPEIITRLMNEAGSNIDPAKVRSLTEGRDFILEDLFTDAEREAYMLSVITGEKYAVAAHSGHTSSLAEKLFGKQKLQDLQLYVDGDKVGRIVNESGGVTREAIPHPKTLLEQAKDGVVGRWNGFIDGIVDMTTESTLGWVQKTKPGFNVHKTLQERKGAFVELAGPTPEGFEAAKVYGKEDKYFVSSSDGIQRQTDKELIVSNILPEGYVYSSKCNPPVAQEPISLLADATRVPLKNGSVGAIFISCLPKNTRKDTLKQAYNALEDEGLLIWQGGFPEDIIVAENTGFKIFSYAKRYFKNSDGTKDYEYRVVLQKTNAKGLESDQVIGKTPLEAIRNFFNGIFNAGKKQSLSWEVAWA